MSGVLTLIKDLVPGESVTTHGLVTESKISQAKKGDDFASFTLVDGASEVKCIRFECSQAPEKGGVYEVKGQVQEFNGLQIKADSFKKIDLDPDEFVRVSRFTREFLDTALRKELDQLEGELGDVLREIFNPVWEEFLSAPAAMKNHHAHARGLAEHTWSMIRIAHRVSNHYLEAYPGMYSRELLVAGCFLHDLGKIKDYTKEGAVWETSVAGELVGHMTHCVVMIHDACQTCFASPELEERLIHLVLSHHGQIDFGSPVKPKTMEALILHHIDMMDAHAEMMRVAIESTDGVLTDYVRPLGVRCVR